MIAKEFLREKIVKAKTILNLGAGKIDNWMLPVKNQLILNVDSSYPDCSRNVEDQEIMKIHEKAMRICDEPHMFNISCDIFDFIDVYPYKFDLIIANRIFEHMFYDAGEVGRLLSGCHSMLADGGILVIMVPDHKKIMEMTLSNPTILTQQNPIIALKQALIINTELCNTRLDPHGSIWTPELANMYIHQEGTFVINDIIHDVMWDDRDCYMIIELYKKSEPVEEEKKDDKGN